jgi:hypothetical protein
LSKTGTTSIQSFLRGNPDVLAAHGVIYPDLAGGRSTHPALAPSVLKRDAGREVHHLALAMEIRQGNNASPTEQAHTPLWSGVFDRIAASNAHTAIISYENFYIRPDRYRFDLLRARLQSFDVRGLIYLRPQEDWLVALYSQLVRGVNRSVTPISDFIRQQRENLSFSVVLDRIKTYIPIDSLFVADFDDASATGLLADFVERIGLPPEIAVRADNQTLANRTPPHWVTLFLLRCNQAGISDEVFAKVRGALTRELLSNNTPELRPGLDVATPEDREGLRAVADADADRLRERYGVSMVQRTRAPVAYRPFDDNDVEAVRTTLAAKLSRSVLDALVQV